MIVIVCVDNKNGVLFNRRRQSSDRILRERILAMTKDTRLWMNAYSAGQFVENAEIFVDEEFLAKAKAGEYCFVENVDFLPFLDTIEKLVIFRWNTVYPSDMWFPAHILEGKVPLSVQEFAGNSHPKITEEIYEW